MTETDAVEKAKLEAKLAGLELLREDLDPAIYRARRDEYAVRLATLDQTGGGAVVAGHVTTGGGDFIGRNQFNQFKIDIRIEAGAYRGEAPRTREQRLAIYRAVLAARTGDLPLRGFDPEASDTSSTRSDLSLAGVYISLDTRMTATVKDLKRALAAVRAGRTPKPLRPSAPGPGGPEREATATRAVTALESAVLHRAQVLLGSPGSGKTTFVHYLAHALATGEAGRLHWPEAERGALPILVVLRDLAAWLAGSGGSAGGAAGRRPSPALLWDFVRHDLQERNLTFAADLLEEALDTGQALVLLDGLDEVPAGTLATVRDSIDAFAGRYRDCRYLVTCRILSYRKPQWRLPETTFPPIELAPFDSDQVDAFIGAWYAEVAARWQVPKAEADRKADTLRGAVRRPDLWRLAATPMLLTVMALVHTHHGELPEARAQLYREAVDILLWRWERQKQCGRSDLGDLLAAAGRHRGDLLSLLERLAFAAHGRGAAAAGEGTDDAVEAVADIGELDLLKALQPLHPQHSLDWAEQVVAALKLRAGLLIETQPGIFSLLHRTFQEYLAGAHLARQGNFAQRALDLVVEGRAWWREVILLAVGDLVHNKRETERPLFLAHRLCSSPDLAQTPVQDQTGPADDAAWRQVWLAGDVLLEVGLGRVGDTDFGRDVLNQVHHRLADLVAGGWLEVRERAEAGDVLGRLGDPRFDPRNFHLPTPVPGRDQAPLGLIRITPGPFVMGSRQGDQGARDDEYGNPPSLAIDYPYWIARYPVTVDQFRCFVAAGGFDDPQWWTARGWDWRTGRYDTKAEDWLKAWLARRPPERRRVPFRWGEQAVFGNRPITGVCWFEAMAYARWLDAQVQVQTQDRAPGYGWRLPTEGEWEKAARGTSGRVYAWGDAWNPQRANVDGVIGRPTVVGMYPHGATPEGVLDLTGNVWEWCLSLYERYPYSADRVNDPDADGRRVVRGGSWNRESRYACCAYRFRLDSGHFSMSRGFRLVLSLADSGF